MIAFLAIALLQQASSQAPTTPPSGDTTGYWQQRADYTIVASLDEAQTKLRARGTLVYVNNSPDTLREMFFHQYLNAFRPGSKWSAADEREGVQRFQRLRDPDHGYERFTSPPVVNGTPVVVDYPGAPDSTVAHFMLPALLPPGDSVRIAFEWEARPSTLPRRQGRRGRTWDFAQWYPKVAVYDRLGWQPNPLIPAGEFYGEFGTFDVTMIVRDDQVLASTGVPVSGDPGWARVSRTGPPFLASRAYGDASPVPAPELAPEYHAVRFVAENVHHFAWSASPDYRYEGGTYVRAVPHTRFPTWDTVAVHVLFKPGDDTTWGGGRALDRTLVAARWLESIWGPYAYPQITNVHRIDGGGTEFPMMIMDGSASQGLILHEFGHVFSYGILANNEWRSGWLDEGLTDYQTSWAQRMTPQERIGRPQEPPLLARGYRVNAASVPPSAAGGLDEWYAELRGRTQPIGTPAFGFREFGIYNDMVYRRASLMYSQLRDVMGDSLFAAFLRDYYSRWALRHVDELAMRASAERVYGKRLDWFFNQWIRETGLMDYSVGNVRVNTDGTRYETIVQVYRDGSLMHPMPVGVLTASGWTIARADPVPAEQTVRIVTNERPTLVELDPHHVTWDWDWRNNARSGSIAGLRAPRIVFDYPFLNQEDRSHTLVALSPAGWYTNPQGLIVGARAKTSYLTAVDRYDVGLGFATRARAELDRPTPSVLTRFQIWGRFQDPYLPGMSRPLTGVGGGVNYLDGILKLDAAKTWDLSPFAYADGPRINARVYATTAVTTSTLLLPEQWSNANVVEIGASGEFRTPADVDDGYAFARGSAGGGLASRASTPDTAVRRGYAHVTAAAGVVRPFVGRFSQIRLRVFGGYADNAPRQRAIYASSQDPLETFTNDLFRGRGAIFKQDGVNYLPLGGAGLRGLDFNVPLERVVAGNGELLQRLVTRRGGWGNVSVSLSVFGDVGVASSKYAGLTTDVLSDAGAGLAIRGRLYDRDFSVRLDAPIFVNSTGFGWRGLGSNGSVAPRWVLSMGDLW